MTVGGYPTKAGYMGYDSRNDKYILFATEAEYEEWVAEQEKEEF